LDLREYKKSHNREPCKVDGLSNRHHNFNPNVHLFVKKFVADLTESAGIVKTTSSSPTLIPPPQGVLKRNVDPTVRARA
jgi:hypothetical protein